MKSSAEELAAQVEAVVFDVDGVLTAGDIVYGPGGEWKAFHVQDGQGFDLARNAGLPTALLSARRSEALRRRAADLHVAALRDGLRGKADGLQELLAEIGLTPAQACYVGDDLVDLPPMRLAGFPVAVANAAEEVKRAAAWTTSRPGGRGAAREVIEFILKAKGLWEKAMEPYGGSSI